MPGAFTNQSTETTHELTLFRILSMPVDKALKSRRPSQSNLRTYLPTGSSSSSLAQLSRTGGVGRHSPQVATEDDLRWDQHAGYHEDDIIETLQVERSPSRLPRRASDTSLRSSTSRQSELPPLPIGPIVPISKSRSTSPTTTLLSQRGGSYSPGKGGTPLAASRIQARKGSIGSERNDYREGGPPNKRKLVDTTAGKTSFPNGGNENNKKKISPDGGTTTSRRTPSPTATTSSLGMGKAPRFPTSSPSSSLSKSKSTARPQNQSTKSDPSPKPRPRAQTQNWKTATTQQRSVSSSIISTLATNGSGSGSLGSATTRKPGIATRGGVERVQTRQRSASTTGVTPPPKWAKDDLEVGNDPNPPWFQNDVPRVFRDGTTGELGRTGRLDELVLPGSFPSSPSLHLGQLNNLILTTPYLCCFTQPSPADSKPSASRTWKKVHSSSRRGRRTVHPEATSSASIRNVFLLPAPSHLLQTRMDWGARRTSIRRARRLRLIREMERWIVSRFRKGRNERRRFALLRNDGFDLLR